MPATSDFYTNDNNKILKFQKLISEKFTMRWVMAKNNNCLKEEPD